MNKKILLNITLPATQGTYDVWVPESMTLLDATKLVTGLLKTREGDRFTVTETTSLIERESGDLLDPSKTLEELEFVDGTELVLV